VLPFSESALLPFVYSACARVIQKHPILSAVPVTLPRDNETSFVQLPTIDLTRCVRIVQRTTPRSTKATPDGFYPRDAELDELLELEHNSSWRDNLIRGKLLPTWRLVIVTEPTTNTFTACFVYHHSLGDGGSGPAFQRAFASALTAEIISVPDGHYVCDQDTTLLPAIESTGMLTVSRWYLIKEVAKSMIPWLSSASSSLWSGGPQKNKPRTRVYSIFLSPALSSKFLSACHASKTTITGALLAITASTLFQILPAHFDQLVAQVPVSLRPLMPQVVDKEDICVFVTAAILTYHRAQFSHEDQSTLASDLVVVSQQSRRTIVDYLAKGTSDLSISLLPYVTDLKSFFLEKQGRKRESSFEISNLGVAASHDGARDIQRMTFSQSANGAGSALQISCITGGDGCLVLCTSWQDGIVDQTIIHDFFDQLPKTLQQYCT